eukprot:TRINITY_DN6742_c0_g1_i1.p1 TRINITY_DN6742_c0_g1~~TRINITY_DN6742_c0_g1_i1.p1  ORF type:complete len:279 (+),score=43.99 TRINITY_DN6742_c0_g1_i1:96-932(+)
MDVDSFSPSRRQLPPLASGAPRQDRPALPRPGTAGDRALQKLMKDSVLFDDSGTHSRLGERRRPGTGTASRPGTAGRPGTANPPAQPGSAGRPGSAARPKSAATKAPVSRPGTAASRAGRIANEVDIEIDWDYKLKLPHSIRRFATGDHFFNFGANAEWTLNLCVQRGGGQKRVTLYLHQNYSKEARLVWCRFKVGQRLGALHEEGRPLTSHPNGGWGVTFPYDEVAAAAYVMVTPVDLAWQPAGSSAAVRFLQARLFARDGTDAMDRERKSSTRSEF